MLRNYIVFITVQCLSANLASPMKPYFILLQHIAILPLMGAQERSYRCSQKHLETLLLTTAYIIYLQLC